MQTHDLSFDSKYFRTALGRFATGVTVVTTERENDDQTFSPLGLTVNSFNAVSLSPPLVLWSIAHAASTHGTFMSNDSYVIHVLASEQSELAMRFARGTQAERFAEVSHTRAPGGTLMLDAPCASWFECTHHSRHDAGDHTIMVGRVINCGHNPLPPLVFHAGGFDLTPLPTAPGTPSA